MIISKQSWRWFYIAWFIYCFVIGSISATNIIMERIRAGGQAFAWHAWVTEFTGIMALFVLVPLLRRYDEYFTFRRQDWKVPLAAHLLFTIPFALIHTALFVGVRKLIFPLFGASYTFGDLPFELIYEYRKICTGYFSVLVSLYAFRHYLMLGHLLDLPEAHHDRTQTKASQYLQRLIATKNDREVIINTGDVLYLEAAGNYIVVHTTDAQYKLRASLTGIEDQLNPKDFARIHRSFLVNINAVKEIQPWFRGDQKIVLRNGTMLNLSRRYRDRFAEQATGRIDTAAA